MVFKELVGAVRNRGAPKARTNRKLRPITKWTKQKAPKGRTSKATTLKDSNSTVEELKKIFKIQECSVNVKRLTEAEIKALKS